MSTLHNCLTLAIEPAQQILGIPRTPQSDVQMLAMGLQESRLTHRRQLVGNPPMPTGPATGLWQFEEDGGVRGVMRHPSSKGKAELLCKVRNVGFDKKLVWRALQNDDVLAAGFARLLLWTDPKPLPALGNPQAAWDYYVRNWRPGKPHRATWDGFYDAAMAEVAP